MERKAKLIAALRAFMEQRPGIEPANYGFGMDGWRNYRSESRSVTRDLHDARELLRAIEWRDSITADHIIAATRAYSGRLQLIERENGSVVINYCTGQYFPTEFRRAVAAVCASALWDWQRDNMPDAPTLELCKQSPGGWLRDHFSREFGRRLQSRYFD